MKELFIFHVPEIKLAVINFKQISLFYENF